MIKLPIFQFPARRRCAQALAGGSIVLGIYSLVLAMPVRAQEASSEPVPAAEELVAETDVPTPDSFGDFFQRMNERMQLLMTRDQNRKAQLELKFANRRETQLSKCAVLKDEGRRDKCTQKVSERSEKLLQRLENRAENMQEKREALQEKLEQARQRRQEKVEDLKQKRQEIKENAQERMEKTREKFMERKEKVKQRVEKRKEAIKEKRDDRKERREGKMEQRGKREVEESDEVEDEVEDGEVEGVSTYDADVIEKVENWLDGWFAHE